MHSTNLKVMDWFIILVEAVMHRLWRALAGRHHPDLHLNSLSETCFWQEIQILSAQMYRWTVEEDHVLQVGMGLAGPDGWKVKLVLSILNSNVLGYVHKLLLDEVSNDFVIRELQSDGLQSPGASGWMFQPQEVK